MPTYVLCSSSCEEIHVGMELKKKKVMISDVEIMEQK
jgi:hypothetical protein